MIDFENYTSLSRKEKIAFHKAALEEIFSEFDVTSDFDYDSLEYEERTILLQKALEASKSGNYVEESRISRLIPIEIVTAMTFKLLHGAEYLLEKGYNVSKFITVPKSFNYDALSDDEKQKIVELLSRSISARYEEYRKH